MSDNNTQSKAAAVRDLPMSASLEAVIRCGKNFVRIIVEDLPAGQGKTHSVPVSLKSDKRVFACLNGKMHGSGTFDGRVEGGSGLVDRADRRNEILA